MLPETQALVDAIVSLKQSNSFFKSYFLPFLPVVISTFAGFMIASYNFKNQEAIRADAKKIDDANKFIVQIDSAFQSLISMKIRYQFHMDNDPIQRALSFGSINCYFSEIKGVENLVFLAKANKAKEGDPYYVTWNNIPRINAMVGSYIYLTQRVVARNKVREQLDECLPSNEKGEQCIDFSKINPKTLHLIRLLINETEIVVSMTDSLILEINSFLIGITKAIDDSVNFKKTKHLVTLVEFKVNNPFILKSLEPIIRPDFIRLAEALGIDEEQARSNFDSGYF
jgi:hypothetical protein